MAFGINDFKPFIDWMQMNPGLSALAVFCISCAESLAIVGLFIPGTIVMPAIGSMIGAGVLPAHWIILAAILGAILGDNLSYWLGYYFHKRIRNIWPFNHFPKLLSNGEIFFNRYGGLSVFIGRFAGPVRPIIPVVAGMLNMPPLNFFIANITSAIAWAVIYMAPGILLGAISEQLAPHVAARLLVILAIITFLVWLCCWLLNKAWNHTYRAIERFSMHWWLYLVDRFSFVQFFIHGNRRNNPKPLSIFFFFTFFTILLAATSFSVAHQGLITLLNWPVFFFCRSIQIFPLDILMAYVFNMTHAVTLTCVCLSVLAALFFQHAWRASLFWLLNIFLAFCLSVVIQLVMKASPPDPHSSFYAIYSYPSVHLAVFTAMVGNFMMFTYYNPVWLKYKKYIVLGLLALIACASVPLLYFGFNWLSDCIASFACGCLTTWLSILFFYRKSQPIETRPLVFIAFTTLLVAMFSIGITNTTHFLERLEKPAFSLNYSLDNWWQKNSLPIPFSRTNFLGTQSELLTVQYAGNLQVLIKTLEKQGWVIAPKANLAVILNRIGAKDRSQQLPLFPDLYQAQKPVLIMTKLLAENHQMLILRLWSSQILLHPKNVPLWVGTLKFHQTWHWHKSVAASPEANISPTSVLVNDLPRFKSLQTQTDQSLCHNDSCQADILKLMTLQKNPLPDDLDDDDQ
ncbi:MAG: lssY [Gammaproteobacteria bacterium]|jgi:membrane protein DedA with SNARE-associated domain|nr:lssY [Gammaproteobacteria bacterium]